MLLFLQNYTTERPTTVDKVAQLAVQMYQHYERVHRLKTVREHCKDAAQFVEHLHLLREGDSITLNACKGMWSAQIQTVTRIAVDWGSESGLSIWTKESPRPRCAAWFSQLNDDNNP